MQATKATFFVLPAASVPGAEEDGAVHVGLRHQVPAEGHGGRVGTRMDYGRQLVPDAVSSHRRHGEVSGRAGRWQQWICGLLTGMATGVSRRVISGHEICAIKPIITRRKASEQASEQAVDQLRQGNIFRLFKLEHAIFRHPPKQAA